MLVDIPQLVIQLNEPVRDCPALLGRVLARCAALRTFWLTATFANSITTRTFQLEHGAAELSTSATVPTQGSWTGANLDERIFGLSLDQPSQLLAKLASLYHVAPIVAV